MPKKIIIPALVFIITLILYNLRSPVPQGGDTVPGRYLPFSILCHGDFDLNEFTFLYKNENKPPYYMIHTDSGKLLSIYGAGQAIVVLPFYAIVLLFKNHFDFNSVLILSKIIASLFVALSVMFLYLTARRLSSASTAILAAITYGLGSSTFAICSQGLWQQSTASVFLTLGLYLFILSENKSKWITGFSSLALSFAFFNRPQLFIVWGVLLIFVLIKRRRAFFHYFLLAFPVLLFIIAYKSFYFGSLFAFPQIEVGRENALYHVQNPSTWSTPLFEGLTGLLFSPSRGLLIFSPIFIFSFMGMFKLKTWKSLENLTLVENSKMQEIIAERKNFLAFLSFAAICILILMSKWYAWWGGWAYAYRMIVDITPILSLLLMPVISCFPAKKYILKFLLILFLTFSVYLQFLGAYSANFLKWHAMADVDKNHRRLWSIKDSMLIYYLKHPDFSHREKWPDFNIAGSTDFTACPIKINRE